MDKKLQIMDKLNKEICKRMVKTNKRSQKIPEVVNADSKTGVLV